MNFLQINNENVERLYEFIKEMGSSSKSFRYFSTREPRKVINNHVTTFLLIDDVAVGYGHLDKEDDKVWLGICVSEKYQGKGYGKKIMNKLVDSYNGDIYLSVDDYNNVAISLYEAYGFKKVSHKNSKFFMKKEVL